MDPQLSFRNQPASRKAFRSYSQTLNGVTETTIWYYNSNGPNFKFKIMGGLPAPEKEMIDWIEKNYKRYQVVHVPYEGDVPDSPPNPTNPVPSYVPTTEPTTRRTYPPTTRRTYPPTTTTITTTTTTTTSTTQRPKIDLKWNQILPSECGYSGFYLGKKVLGKVVGATPAPIELNPWQVCWKF